METSDIIAIGAALVASASLALSVYELAENKPKLRILARTAIIGTEPPQQSLLVALVNFGRQPTTIQGITFVSRTVLPSNKLFLMPLAGVGSTMPHVLDVGRSATIAFDLNGGFTDAMCKRWTLLELIRAGGFEVRVSSAWHKAEIIVRVADDQGHEVRDV